MSPTRALWRAAQRLFRPGLPVWYRPEYRVPLPSIEARTGMQPRRAAWVLEWLLSERIVALADVRAPEQVTWDDLARVHEHGWLDALTLPESLGRVFGLDPWEVPVDELLSSLRYAVGGTIDAAREAVRRNGPTLNLLGGFHHAGPNRGAGFCALNDIATAAAVLRAEGFKGSIAVLDLDAHPPDGTAACLGKGAWIGSISGSDWGDLDGVDETVIPAATDDVYLAALDALLGRMPSASLTFVLAGADVLAGDPLGQMALSLHGVRRRDARVYERLSGGSVWLPAGGYRAEAWRVLAGTALVLAGEPGAEIPAGYDPMAAGFGRIFASIPTSAFTLPDVEAADIDATLLRRSGGTQLLGFYSVAGVELALARYGILQQLRRLGYASFRVATDRTEIGDRARLWGTAEGKEHLLVEAVLERGLMAGRSVLFVHWLTLRHPRGAFAAGRTALPGQEVPGLGMAREAGALLATMAQRLGLAGVAFRPSWYHVARSASPRMRFLDPGRQGRFEALIRDTADLPLREVSRALAEDRVVCGPEVYRWEPDDMVEWLAGGAEDRAAVEAEAARVRFAVSSGRPELG